MGGINCMAERQFGHLCYFKNYTIEYIDRLLVKILKKTQF